MAQLQISQRGIDMPASPIRKLAPLAYSAEDRGIKIYRLNIGTTRFAHAPESARHVEEH